MSEIAHLVATIYKKASGRQRFVVAIAGPPGAGKSVLAETMLPLLPEGSAALVPMDGFHFDNGVLEARGLRTRKGAPETFDFAGFATLLKRIREGGEDIAVPTFDRDADLARAGASIIPRDARFIIVEGNYLLFKEDPWAGLAPLFDFSIFLDVPREELKDRLVRRWLDNGHSPEEARQRATSNDMANAERILAARGAADVIFAWKMAE